MLPLLLGMLGLIYHCIKNRKDAFVVFLMFFMTGLAIAIYLNMPPRQPRERDYAFVGSFYFFSVWIGLGVYALYDWLSTKFGKKERNGYLIAGAVCVLLGLLLNGAAFILTLIGAVLIIVSVVRLPKAVAMPLAFVLAMTVPVILGAENWDDHDRSQKTAARDFAKNYLGLADKNGVVITFGDNDTFPLWYVQEVEGWRTDVRILNYTLSGMHWYVEQLYNKLYESDPLPFTFPKEMYGLGYEIYVYNPDGPRMEVTDALQTVLDNRRQYVRRDRGVDSVVYLPTNKFKITLNKPKLIDNGIVTPEIAEAMPDYISFDVNIQRRGYLTRNEMMMLDFLGTNRFERPVSIMNTSYIREVFPVVDNYSIDDGMLSLLVPYPTNGDQYYYSDRTADYFINGFRNDDGSRTPLQWGNLNKDIYIDPVSKNMGDVQRQTFVLLSNQKLVEGDTASAVKMLDLCEEFFPKSNFPNDRFAMMTLFAYRHVGNSAKAYDIVCDIFDYYLQQLTYAKQLTQNKSTNADRLVADASYFLYQAVQLRSHGVMRNPFDSRAEVPLTEEGEQEYRAANPDAAQRLKAIDDFATSSVFKNEVLPLVNSMR